MPFVFTIQINQGGSALSKQNLTSQVNGLRAQFRISEEIQSGSLRVYWNGVRQVESSTFTENSSSTFTTSFTPQNGETLVVDNEKIGTFGDLFQAGPTELDRDVRPNESEDAERKLLNRLKFGTESLLLAPWIVTGKQISK